jgi:hypothetical protein
MSDDEPRDAIKRLHEGQSKQVAMATLGRPLGSEGRPDWLGWVCSERLANNRGTEEPGETS